MKDIKIAPFGDNTNKVKIGRLKRVQRREIVSTLWQCVSLYLEFRKNPRDIYTI